MKKMKLMLIGPCEIGVPEIDGRGAEILFALLREDLDALGVDYTLIDSSPATHRGRFTRWASILASVVLQLRSVSHISIHSSRSYLFLLPPILLLNALLRRHVSLRLFGGDFKDRIDGRPSVGRFLARACGRNVSALFLETQANVTAAKRRSYRAHWLPNSRRVPEAPGRSREYRRRFVFISQIRSEKGVQILLDAADALDASYTVDFYGTLVDDFDWAGRRAKYRGALAPGEVYSVMAEYDVVVLPTFYRDEGYPGVVLEAYASGRPVIATRWRDLPEIVEDGVTGRLIPPRDARALRETMEGFNPENHARLAAGAAARFSQTFHSTVQSRRFLETLTSRC